MAEHSEAAQAILAAIDRCFTSSVASPTSGDVAAAVLRAATGQVLPERESSDTEEWIGQSAWVQAEQQARFRFLAVANELDGKDSAACM